MPTAEFVHASPQLFCTSNHYQYEFIALSYSPLPLRAFPHHSTPISTTGSAVRAEWLRSYVHTSYTHIYPDGYVHVIRSVLIRRARQTGGGGTQQLPPLLLPCASSGSSIEHCRVLMRGIACCIHKYNRPVSRSEHIHGRHMAVVS